jgi:hypothetical protein
MSTLADKPYTTNFNVNSIPLSRVLEANYDVAFLGCGYESRSTHIASRIDHSKADNILTLAHEKNRNDTFYYNKDFLNNVSDEFVTVSTPTENEIYNILNKYRDKNSLKVLVDYSSMSKYWYNGILKWSEISTQESKAHPDSDTNTQEVLVDFVYSVGSYQEDFEPLTIGEITPLPGRDASHLSQRDSLAVFGLGYDPIVVESVYNRIEPDKVFAFLASPGANSEAADKVESDNRFFIEDHVDGNPLSLPLKDIPRTCAHLRELVLPYLEEFYVMIISLGPKPHVLSSLLTCMKYPKYISCLSVTGDRKNPVNVKAEGDVVCTRVFLRNK